MELTDELENRQHHADEKANGVAEESCILVEDEISLIEIDDTIVDSSKMLKDGELNTTADAANLSEAKKENSELILSEFQVVDEIGSVEGSGSQEEMNSSDAPAEVTELTVSEGENKF